MKRGKTRLYIAPIKRIVHEAGCKINKQALLKLEEHLVKHIAAIAKRASVFAEKEHRKIIKPKDIEEATKEGWLVSE